MENLHNRFDGQSILILDTCIWLNFLKTVNLDSVIFKKLSELLHERDIVLFTPKQVIEEWDRNQPEVMKRLNISVDNSLEQTKTLSNFLPDTHVAEYSELMEQTKKDIRRNMLARNTAMKVLIDDLIKKESWHISIKNNEIKNLVIDFALEGKKPFTKNKNSMGDAIIFFSIYDHIKRDGNEHKNLYFVTDNIQDYSQGTSGNNRSILHDDLKPYADEINLKYSTNIAQLINKLHGNSIEKAIEQGIERELYYKYTTNPECPRCTEKMDSAYRPSYYDTFEWIHLCKACGEIVHTGREQTTF
ncbi:PIN domain-containing protein [Bacillus cereus]|nr:PIN domain-containing protein [Bacillus cereus]